VKRAVFLRQSSRPIPRVARMMRVAKELGYEPKFLGAMREAGLPREDQWEGLAVERIGIPFPLVNGTKPLTYVWGTVRYSLAAFRRLWKLRPDVVHASDIECGVAALVYHWARGGRLIYNIHDNLSQRYAVPRVVRTLLNALEGAVAAAADVTLVPEGFRRDSLPAWSRRKVLIVRNSPEDPGFSSRARNAGDPIRLFFGGWLDRGRGLQGLADLVASNRDFELVVAGEGSPETVAWLESLPKVEYLGFLSHGRIIEETRRCDVVVALYDPRRLINIYAASNKIAEALAVGRPVLVNEEARVAEYLEPRGCCVTTPYAAIADAGGPLRELVSDPARYAAACQAARRCYDSDYHYTAVRQQMVRAYGDQESLSA
jgi:glycosyltransferase involved in cell wall biosynthesis